MQRNGWDGRISFIANGMSSGKECLNIIGQKRKAMTTSQKQISLFTEDESTSSPAGFRANLTPKRVSDLEKKMTATSGRKCLEQFGRFNHVGSWAKTFAGLLVGMKGWYSMKCRLTWKLKGTKSSRFYFQLAPSTHPTEEIESGLLPTVKTFDAGSQRKLTNGQNVSKKGEKYGIHLTQMAQAGLLPTPMAQSRKTDEEKTLKRKEQYGGMKRAMYLENYLALGLLPTPTAQASRANTSDDRKKGNLSDKIAEKFNPPGKTSQLNPRFVMEMMGFPPDWTELPFLSGETNQSKPEETP